jgi:prefoldin subunit 2
LCHSLDEVLEVYLSLHNRRNNAATSSSHTQFNKHKQFKMAENSSSSSAANSSDDSNAEVILGTYKRMAAECQQIAAKIQELNMERDEHRLVVDTLTKLEPERKAFRLIGGVLVERTVVEVLPAVQQHYEGVS